MASYFLEVIDPQHMHKCYSTHLLVCVCVHVHVCVSLTTLEATLIYSTKNDNGQQMVF